MSGRALVRTHLAELPELGMLTHKRLSLLWCLSPPSPAALAG